MSDAAKPPLGGPPPPPAETPPPPPGTPRPQLETPPPPPESATQKDDGLHSAPCHGCGADLRFEPGIQQLECPYCGSVSEIETSEVVIEELDFRAFLAQAEESAATLEVLTVTCRSCNAETTLEDNVTASLCPFCGTALVAQAESKRLIQPKSILPFAIEERQANALLDGWIKGRWFAPGKLKKYARNHGMDGVYTPYWTYDCHTTSQYSGRRGEYYYVNRTVGSGSQRRSQRERKTRWYPASGTVYNHFDDIVVLASDSLPRRYVEELTPWDLENLVPFDKRYLTGFRVESYRIDLQPGFEDAQRKMEPRIRQTVRQDIGGDTQQISTLQSAHRDITFKHTLLPIWMCAYRFQGKVYRVLINARTGEVQGERPYSWAKILLTVITILIVLILLFNR